MSNESRLSITDSLTEFYDAQEVLLSSSSSENEVSVIFLVSKSRHFMAGFVVDSENMLCFHIMVVSGPLI